MAVRRGGCEIQRNHHDARSGRVVLDEDDGEPPPLQTPNEARKSNSQASPERRAAKNIQQHHEAGRAETGPASRKE